LGQADIGKLINEGSAELQKLAPAVREAFFQNEGSLSDTVVIFVDFDPKYATNIQIGHCRGDSAQARFIGSDPQRIVTLYAALGVKSQSLGTIDYHGTKAPFLKVEVGDNLPFDAYQALLLNDTCFSYAQLFTRANDQAPLEAFRTFLALLRYDG